MKTENRKNFNTDYWAERLRPVLFPHPAVRWAVILSAAILLVLCLNGTIKMSLVLYFSYHYSTYALVIFCTWLPGAFRSSREKFEQLIEKNEFLNEIYYYMSDIERRTRFLLVPSLLFNLLYAVFKLISGIWMNSIWLIGTGVYYAVLAVMRFRLLHTFYYSTGLRLTDPRLKFRLRGPERKSSGRRSPMNIRREWETYRATAWCLLGLTIIMGGLIVQMLVDSQAYHYPGVLIYAFGLYAFIKIITAVFSLIRHRHRENRLLAASRCVSFACALMSMMALQTALIDRFGSAQFAQRANAVFGTCIFAVMLGMCIYMLKRSKRHLQKA